MTKTTTKRKPGHQPGVPNPNGGRKAGPNGRKEGLQLKIDPELKRWIKTLPPGETERILSRAHAAALIV